MKNVFRVFVSFLFMLFFTFCAQEIPRRTVTPEKISNSEKMNAAIYRLKELLEMEPDEKIKVKMQAWLRDMKVGGITSFQRIGDSFTFDYYPGTNPDNEVLLLEVSQALMQSASNSHSAMMYNPDLSGGQKHIFANTFDLSNGTIEETAVRLYHELIHVYQYHAGEREKYFPKTSLSNKTMGGFLKDQSRFNRELMASQKTSALFMLIHPEFQPVTAECNCDEKIGPQLNRLIRKIGDKETAGKVVENACPEQWVREIVLR